MRVLSHLTLVEVAMGLKLQELENYISYKKKKQKSFYVILFILYFHTCYKFKTNATSGNAQSFYQTPGTCIMQQDVPGMYSKIYLTCLRSCASPFSIDVIHVSRRQIKLFNITCSRIHDKCLICVEMRCI